jgi:hypothetical protein
VNLTTNHHGPFEVPFTSNTDADERTPWSESHFSKKG